MVVGELGEVVIRGECGWGVVDVGSRDDDVDEVRRRWRKGDGGADCAGKWAGDVDIRAG